MASPWWPSWTWILPNSGGGWQGLASLSVSLLLVRFLGHFGLLLLASSIHNASKSLFYSHAFRIIRLKFAHTLDTNSI